MAKTNTQPKNPDAPAKPNLGGLLKPYMRYIIALVVFTIAANALNLILPKIISHAIDAFIGRHLVLRTVVIEFSLVAIGVFVFTFLQTVVQTYASERVARDLRTKLIRKISMQAHAYIDTVTPAKLLTNLTSDTDAVKTFVAQAIASIISSIVLIIGASILLISINWKLALAVLAVVPIIGVTFAVVLGKVRKLFLRAQGAIDWLNKVINESILGSALIRLVNSQAIEYDKFIKANTEARDISLSILRLFAALIPVITFMTNLAILTILALGGHFVIGGSMSIGDFTAFQSYLSILIFPILVIGFMSNVIAQASASYGRIESVLSAPDRVDEGTRTEMISGQIEVRNIALEFAERSVLKDVSFTVAAGSRTAIIGPTAAGKTQLLYILTGIVLPTSGEVLYDGHPFSEYKKEQLHEEIGFVFQDSVMFNLTLRENIAFNTKVSTEDLERAIRTAELSDFIAGLPDGLDTLVSERGTTLSGGQKQRVMLARALALNPRVLFLDDFTARVDTRTERKILSNVKENYPLITIISVTQKISSVEDYDEIVLLMEGEVIARGTHAKLLETTPEYVQIYNSQESTEHYESEK